jgi:hypothetical protein
MTGVALIVFSGLTMDAQSFSVKEIIPKATAYSHQFVERFSNVVAEERYEQEITAPRRKRLLVSDFLLVKYPGDALWQSFRDVAEVDGKPIRDREDRIMKLFLEPSSSALRRASELGPSTIFGSTSPASTRRSDRTCGSPDSSSLGVRRSSSGATRQTISSRAASSGSKRAPVAW